MVFHGFQKLTLLDFPGHVAATVFTAGCNLRCPFCHNALLVTDIQDGDRIDEEEIVSYLVRRKGLLDGVAVTGGEPLLQPDLPRFVGRLRELGYAVKLDTNGCFPDRLKPLLDARLVDYVAMDVKNTAEKYALTVGIPDFDPAPVWESARIIMASGVDYEFRTTVVNEFHEIEDVAKIAERLSGAKRYFLQNFVDSGGLIGTGMKPRQPEELHAMREAAARFIPETALRGVE